MPINFLKYTFFFRFFTFSETFSASPRKIFGDVVITAFFMSRATYWGKIENGFCERSIIFLPILETARKVSVGWSTLHSPKIKDLYADRFFELYHFLTFLNIEREFLGLPSKTFWWGCNHCILRVHRIISRKIKIGKFRKKNKFYIFLGDCKEIFGGVVNTAFTETIWHLCRSFFWKVMFF